MSKDWRTICYRLKNGIYSPFLEKLYKPVFRVLGGSDFKVVKEDWDYLIILDACRYDAFKQHNKIEGKLERRISAGSGTPEWLRKNFTEDHNDIVYTSANPFVSKERMFDEELFKGKNPFESSIDVFDGDFYMIDPVYMDEEAVYNGSIKPEFVTNSALENIREYPGKRHIIHYVQPHDPFIGDTKISYDEGDIEDKYEYFNRSDSRQAYSDNLKLVLEEVEQLVAELEGKIVISADHGDAFGEKGILRHPTGIYIKELVEVPWMVIDKEEEGNSSSEKLLKDIDF